MSNCSQCHKEISNRRADCYAAEVPITPGQKLPYLCRVCINHAPLRICTGCGKRITSQDEEYMFDIWDEGSQCTRRNSYCSTACIQKICRDLESSSPVQSDLASHTKKILLSKLQEIAIALEYSARFGQQARDQITDTVLNNPSSTPVERRAAMKRLWGPLGPIKAGNARCPVCHGTPSSCICGL